MENRHLPERSYQEHGRSNTSDGFIGRRPEREVRRIQLDSARLTITPSIASSPVSQKPSVEPSQLIESSGRRLFSASVNEETLRLDMRLPGAEQLLRSRAKIILSRWRFMRTTAFKTVATSMALLFVVGGWILGQAWFSLNRSFQGGASAVALQEKVDPSLLKGEGDGRVNILLLGNGGIGHEAPDLTDTIMVASIDPVNKKIALVSIPRDLWVSVPGHGSMKINAAYSTGKYDYLGKIDSSNSNDKAIRAGFATADQAVEQVLGITIHYNALVNFISFKQAVDTVGGITVDVPKTLYDPTIAWENGWNATIAKKGKQIFNGKQALLYARSRHTTSDFDRSDRQRAVLTAIKEKAVSLGTLSNPLKLAELFNNFGNNVKTDLSLGDAGRAYSLIKDIPASAITSIGLGDEDKTLVTTGWAGDQSIVLPIAGLNNYEEIHRYIRKQLPDGYIVKEQAVIILLNASTDPNLSKTTATDLRTYGYRVSDNGAYPTPQTNSELIDVSGGTKEYTKNYLERRFGLRATSTLPGGVQAGDADFIILLGNNATTRQ